MSLNTIYLQLQSQIKYIANRNIFHIHIEFHKIQLKLIKYDRYLCTKARWNSLQWEYIWYILYVSIVYDKWSNQNSVFLNTKKNGWSKSQIFCCHCPDIKRRLVLLWQVNEVTGVCDSFTFPFPNDSLRIKRKQIHIPSNCRTIHI